MYSLHSRVSALITTIEPIDGGVPTMTKWICDVLRELNIIPILSWYTPWRNKPELSVPLYKTFSHNPGYVEQVAFAEYKGYGLGSRFPEFEFTHYLYNQKWKSLIASCQLHISVTGNVLSASPFHRHQVPFLAWVATPWEADRINRSHTFSLARRALDSLVNQPISSKLEKSILKSRYGKIIALSKYTANELSNLSQKSISDIMLMPIDTSVFSCEHSRTKILRVGFSGRYCDPRKNISLLLEAVMLVKQSGYDIELVLVGEKDYRDIKPLVDYYGLNDCIQLYAHMASSELALLIQSFDLFVIPSHQEGLCIAALEAMACGIPVISTRCGGPEEYVISGETGELVDSNSSELSRMILEISTNRARRQSLAQGASRWVLRNASQHSSRNIIKSNLIELAKKRADPDLSSLIYQLESL